MLTELFQNRIPEIKPPIYDGRKLSQIPSSEMDRLAASQRNLYSPDESSICTNTTMNVVGPLIATEITQDMQEAYEINGIASPTDHTLYSDTISDIPLYISKDGHSWTTYWSNTDNVLIKNDCGSQIGLLTSGPLAGVIIRPIKNSTCWNNGGNIIRVLNDEVFACNVDSKFPYYVTPPEPEATYEQKESFHGKRALKYQQLALETIGVDTTQLKDIQIKKAAAIISGQGLLITDMIAFQARKMGIDLDKSQMHILSPYNFDAKKAQRQIQQLMPKVQEIIQFFS